MVLFPVEASANLNALYVAAAKNHLYAEQERAAANKYAQEVRELFQRDADLTEQFHTEVADGKWNHMMSQTHIGYTYWQQPEQNSRPEVVEVELSDVSGMGIAVEGSKHAFSGKGKSARLPMFDPFNDQHYYIDVFNKAKVPFSFEIKDQPVWLKVFAESG